MPLKNGRTTAALQTILIGSVIPPGVIQAFGGGTVPSGWLLCDGSTASRSTYAGLFEAIGIVNGQGDGSTTFHLPDLRGRFIRGADNMGTGAAGRDPDAAGRTAANTGGATGTGVGSVQADAFQGHWHNVYGLSQQGVNIGNADDLNLASQNLGNRAREAVTNGVNGVPRVASETRPQNANTSWLIKT